MWSETSLLLRPLIENLNAFLHEHVLLWERALQWVWFWEVTPSALLHQLMLECFNGVYVSRQKERRGMNFTRIETSSRWSWCRWWFLETEKLSEHHHLHETSLLKSTFLSATIWFQAWCLWWMLTKKNVSFSNSKKQHQNKTQVCEMEESFSPGTD